MSGVVIASMNLNGEVWETDLILIEAHQVAEFVAYVDEDGQYRPYVKISWPALWFWEDG